MIPETAMWIAVGANAGFFAAKFFAFRLKSFAQLPELPGHQLPPPLPARFPERKLTEIKEQPKKPLENNKKIPHFKQPELTCVSLPKAVDLLIDWCNGQGLIGIHTSTEIDTYWKTACVELDLQPIDVRFIKEAMDGRGLRIGKKRLCTPEYSAIRKRTGKDRLVLFRIPRARAETGTGPATPATTPDRPDLTRSQPGPVPDHMEKSSQIKRAA